MVLPPIGVTMGDPAGIGPEIVAKLFAEGTPARAVVVGDAGVLRRAAALCGLALEVRAIGVPEEVQGRPGTVDVLDVSSLPSDLQPGRVHPACGAASHLYVQRAVDLALEGRLRAVVTAPIHKGAWHAAGVPFPGHTELLAQRCGVPGAAMMLANEELRVLLVSIHVPLAEALRLVTRDRVLHAIRMAHLAGRQFGVERPRVAVAGLNPHAGEDGMFGGEERDAIAPAVAQARAEGLDASGPWSPDTVFMRARRGEFDVVVAQYHDQGLIPVKYLGVEHGVNVTVGLPIVRTSVDHGTAFDIAGEGRADPSSLRAAVVQADRMSTAPRAGLASANITG